LEGFMMLSSCVWRGATLILFTPQYTFLSPPLPDLIPRFTFISHCYYCHHHHHFRSKFHKWVTTWDIWLFELHIAHSI
jgi:hypothetical protein